MYNKQESVVTFEVLMSVLLRIRVFEMYHLVDWGMDPDVSKAL
jgi:hypothetical protein